MSLDLLPPPSSSFFAGWDASTEAHPWSPLSHPMDLAPPTPPPLTRGVTPAKERQKGGRKPKDPPGVVDLSVFDILNLFRCRWFLSRAHLVTQVISAQKAEDRKLSWVEFPPPFHSHLVKCAVALVPHRGCPLPMVKRVMFVFILELLNGEGHTAFFELQKGSRKANTAQKEKWCLARKRSRAAKQERGREVAKAAQLPSCEQQCGGCGRKFNSRKTAKKHKCTTTKVASRMEKVIEGPASKPKPLTKVRKRPMPAPPPPAPPVPVAQIATDVLEVSTKAIKQTVTSEVEGTLYYIVTHL
ncbi:hypothetical protein EI94DRAFT_1821505 [Lactarius quietus]|nr:hypothetical protein EI94DRAFT_1821505 [Lactarius quietus]